MTRKKALNSSPLSDTEMDFIIPSLLEECREEMSEFLNGNSKWLPKSILNFIKEKYNFEKNEIALRKFLRQFLFDKTQIEKSCVEEMQRIIDDESFFIDILMIMFKERGVSRPKGLREFIKQKMMKDTTFRKRLLMIREPKEFTEEFNNIVSEKQCCKDVKDKDEKKAIVENTNCEKECSKTETKEEKIVNSNEFIKKVPKSILENHSNIKECFRSYKEQVEKLSLRLNYEVSLNNSQNLIIETLNNKLKFQNNEIEILNRKLKVQQFENDLVQETIKTKNDEIEQLHNKLKQQQDEMDLLTFSGAINKLACQQD